MKNFDVSLIEHGLKKGVFSPSAVLDLLYHPLQIIGTANDKNTVAEFTWSINSFMDIPLNTRRRLLELCFVYDDEETTLVLNRRFACVVYTLLKEQHDTVSDLNCCTALFEYAAPADVVEEIHLWHKCGLVMNKPKRYLLKRVWDNMFGNERVDIAKKQIPAWIETQKSTLRQMLHHNRKKAQRRILKLTLAESLIRAQTESTPRDIKELDALKKEAQKLMSDIDTLFEERFALEIKSAVMEIYPILEEKIPPTTGN